MKAGKQFVDDWSKLLDNVTRVAVVSPRLAVAGGKVTIPISPLLWVWRINEPAYRGYCGNGFARRLLLAEGRHEVDFPNDLMRFHNGNLPLHENGMRIHAA